MAELTPTADEILESAHDLLRTYLHWVDARNLATASRDSLLARIDSYKAGDLVDYKQPSDVQRNQGVCSARLRLVALNARIAEAQNEIDHWICEFGQSIGNAFLESQTVTASARGYFN